MRNRMGTQQMWARRRMKTRGVEGPEHALSLAIIIRLIILPASGSG